MLIDYMEDFGLDTKNIDKFEKYKELILEYNKHTNLTRITEEDEFNVKHFLDSLSLFKTGLFDGDKKNHRYWNWCRISRSTLKALQ